MWFVISIVISSVSQIQQRRKFIFIINFTQKIGSKRYKITQYEQQFINTITGNSSNNNVCTVMKYSSTYSS